jgi:hypothetical protein
MGTFNVFYIRVCRTQLDLSGSVIKFKSMDFVLWDKTTKKSCAYRFEQGYSKISGEDKYEVWKFVKKNRDPWDRFVIDTYRDVKDFETDSAQLYSQFKTKETFDTSRDHRIRFVLWIGASPAVELRGKLRYPEPVPPFVEGGHVRHLDKALKYL